MDKGPASDNVSFMGTITLDREPRWTHILSACRTCGDEAGVICGQPVREGSHEFPVFEVRCTCHRQLCRSFENGSREAVFYWWGTMETCPACQLAPKPEQGAPGESRPEIKTGDDEVGDGDADKAKASETDDRDCEAEDGDAGRYIEDLSDRGLLIVVPAEEE